MSEDGEIHVLYTKMYLKQWFDNCCQEYIALQNNCDIKEAELTLEKHGNEYIFIAKPLQHKTSWWKKIIKYLR